MSYPQYAPAYAPHYDGQYSQYGPHPVACSARSFVATWLLAWLGGPLGIDRFYLGKVGTGLLKLFTLGGLGLWAFADLLVVLCGGQRDSDDLPLAGYREHRGLAWAITGATAVVGGAVSYWAWRNGYDTELSTYQY
ncbi:MAG: TM2 domain-containing protein [Micrococcales bacterium]|nr:TM2 domain-containing protein [Micrococcales bacterium]